jgi:hypothetical protein
MHSHSYIVAASLVSFALAYLALVIAGYRRNLWWGTGNLLLFPFSVLPFLFIHWRRSLYALGLGALGVTLFGLGAVVQVATERDTTFRSSTLGYQFTLPKSWHERTGRVNRAEVHASQLLDDLNFAVMPEEVGATLDTASIRAAETLAQRFRVKQPIPRTLRLNGFEAREFDLEGCIDGGCLVYVVTTVRGPHRLVNLALGSQESVLVSGCHSS